MEVHKGCLLVRAQQDRALASRGAASWPEYHKLASDKPRGVSETVVPACPNKFRVELTNTIYTHPSQQTGSERERYIKSSGIQ